MEKELYLLQDGTHADPSDVSRGPDGVLRHKNGLAVCLDANGEPQTVGKDAVRNKNVEAAEAGQVEQVVPAPRPREDVGKPPASPAPVTAAAPLAPAVSDAVSDKNKAKSA